MAFQFKRTEPPGKAMRRLGHERIEKARDQLRHSDHSSAVHGVRKEIKKLRAIFRLVRDEIGKGDYRKGTKPLRQAANRLAAPRDARVMLKALKKLGGREAKAFSDIARALQKHARHEARQFRKDDSAAQAKRLLQKTDRRLDALKIKATGWAAIEPGLKESYRHGRAAHQLAERKPLPENFHDWRKHVKDLWHYFRLLNPAWPKEIRALTDELKKLGEHLGDDHDLAMLQEFVVEHCAGRDRETRPLNRLIVARQKQLRRVALELGARIYAETPVVICRRLENHWNGWRGGVSKK